MGNTSPEPGPVSTPTQANAWLSGGRNPLIEKCTNEWQNSPQYHEATSFESNKTAFDAVTNTLKRICAMTKAPKFQRLVFVSIFATVVAIFYWQYFLSNYVAEEKEAWDTLNSEFGRNRGNVYGQNKRVQFPGMTQLSTLDAKYLPRTSRASLDSASKHRRLIFIGDIHGCMDELQALLAKVEYNQDQDHIVALGDMINKGPKSREVVEFLMEHGASAVRGEVVAVHGGLVPGIKLQDQDPMSVMNMRVIDLKTHMPSQQHAHEGSVPWAQFWNKYEKLIPAQRTFFGFVKPKPAIKHTTVVYGHDSKRGLQIDTYTKGLDTGCVNGTKLTAWVVGDMAKEEIVQVQCKEQRS
ncbi:hypothetical protein LTR70_008764 [Exophiala xenobiotica]|nr:hypothetical protein LTR70_008764 [Exophiala xenobiotica]